MIAASIVVLGIIFIGIDVLVRGPKNNGPEDGDHR